MPIKVNRIDDRNWRFVQLAIGQQFEESVAVSFAARPAGDSGQNCH
jgi:hypothetical protein